MNLEQIKQSIEDLKEIDLLIKNLDDHAKDFSEERGLINLNMNFGEKEKEEEYEGLSRGFSYFIAGSHIEKKTEPKVNLDFKITSSFALQILAIAREDLTKRRQSILNKLEPLMK